MITKLVVKDSKDSPLSYIDELFPNGKEFNFSSGLNIIIGKNGSGKSTLIKLLSIYSLCYDHIESDEKELNDSLLYNNYFSLTEDKSLHKGVEVYGDYKFPVFNFKLMTDKTRSGESLAYNHGFDGFCTLFNGVRSSSGENIMTNYYFFLNRIYTTIKAHKCKFPETTLFDSYKVSCDKKLTILMDEPDKNLDIYNIKDLYSEFQNLYDKKFQVIAVIHNPLLIHKLSQVKDINWIETSTGYLKNIKEEFKYV